MDIFVLYVLSALFFWTLLLTPQLVKNTRQKLFDIRDKVFLNCEHNTEYYRFRNRINALIRFAHYISWQRLLFDFIMLRREIKQQEETKIDFNNDELNKYFLNSILLVMRLMYLRSPTLILLYMPLVLLEVVKFEVWSKLKDKASSLVINDANIYAHHSL